MGSCEPRRGHICRLCAVCGRGAVDGDLNGQGLQIVSATRFERGTGLQSVDKVSGGGKAAVARKAAPFVWVWMLDRGPAQRLDHDPTILVEAERPARTF